MAETLWLTQMFPCVGGHKICFRDENALFKFKIYFLLFIMLVTMQLSLIIVIIYSQGLDLRQKVVSATE